MNTTTTLVLVGVAGIAVAMLWSQSQRQEAEIARLREESLRRATPQPNSGGLLGLIKDISVGDVLSILG